MTNLVQSAPLCILTFFKNKQGYKNDGSGSNIVNLNCGSLMANSSLVPNHSENDIRKISFFITPFASSSEPPGSATSINTKKTIIVVAWTVLKAAPGKNSTKGL